MRAELVGKTIHQNIAIISGIIGQGRLKVAKIPCPAGLYQRTIKIGKTNSEIV
jgi:hypothetical protein